MTNQLPPYNEVFFVHYQCQNFNEGDQIYNLCIVHKNKVVEFSGDDEAHFIYLYCVAVAEKCNQELIPIHWNQTRGYFGTQHIISRYQKLTGKTINLDYPNEIDLSSLLIDMLGDDYVPHPRLDKLATLNNCFGGSIESHNQRTFPANRTMLLAKIYHKLLNNKLITSKTQSQATHQTTSAHSTAKSFSDFLIHSHKDKLANALREEFHHEKGKTMRFVVEAMQQAPSIISISSGEKKTLHTAMQEFFSQNIGSRNSIFQYDYQKINHLSEVNNMRNRINFILDKLAQQS